MALPPGPRVSLLLRWHFCLEARRWFPFFSSSQGIPLLFLLDGRRPLFISFSLPTRGGARLSNILPFLRQRKKLAFFYSLLVLVSRHWILLFFFFFFFPVPGENSSRLPLRRFSPCFLLPCTGAGGAESLFFMLLLSSLSVGRLRLGAVLFSLSFRRGCAAWSEVVSLRGEFLLSFLFL